MAVDVSVMFPPGLQKDGRSRLGWGRAKPKAKNMRAVFLSAASRGIAFFSGFCVAPKFTGNIICASAQPHGLFEALVPTALGIHAGFFSITHRPCAGDTPERIYGLGNSTP